ncbi:MAG TPA: VWA domain-containing protein [Solirubrobacterales bacterium]|nr:VWA domain-containing protein [Solirubrobacterales bacterium]
MKRAWKVLLGATMAMLLAAAAISAPSGAQVGGALASCAPATNIEAIVDDSGSMSFTDPDRLRVQGMNLLIDTLPTATTLGAIEFGGDPFGETPPADVIFNPEPIGPNAKAMRSALDKVINADNGTTDYNAAFATADAANPGAQARIFLTDGGHDEGTYNEAHLAHRVPTYVIGLGLYDPGDKARLKKIAGDTGGQVFEVKEAGDMPAVMNRVGAALTCQTPPRQFTDQLEAGQSKLHGVTVGASTKVLQIALTWSSPGDRFKVTGLQLVAHGHVVAAARPKVRKLGVKRSTGATFTVLKVSKLRRGTLRFKVKAAKVGSGGKVKLTTQVGRGGN